MDSWSEWIHFEACEMDFSTFNFYSFPQRFFPSPSVYLSFVLLFFKLSDDDTNA